MGVGISYIITYYNYTIPVRQIGNERYLTDIDIDKIYWRKMHEKTVNNVVGNIDWELVILSQSSGNVLMTSL